MTLSSLCRLWRTIRYLRPDQIIYRFVFHLARPKPDSRPPPFVRVPDGDWVPGVAHYETLIGPSKFNIFGINHDVNSEGWNPNQLPKLFCYNLHYFNDLNVGHNSTLHTWHSDLISHWIRENPAPHGNGWEPYPISLRIVNWVKWAQTHPKDFTDEMCHSLAVQARFLMRRLEWHLLGNHLFVNAKALIFAGLFFRGPEADKWRSMGFTILRRQVSEQILADGGQFELSPMYHALALEDILDLLAITRRYADGLTFAQTQQSATWAPIVPTMLVWMEAMTHPDGKIALFNDAAFGIAPLGSALQAYATRLGFDRTAPLKTPHHPLPDTGYHRLTYGPAVLIADLAAVGPTYLPAHAHADSLSFELSLGRRRLIVNGGTSQYGADQERHRQRSTPAHSTLTLDGQNSSEVWGGFRVGRRAKVKDVQVIQQQTKTLLKATHTGYTHLPGRPMHQRTWELCDSGLTITDHIASKQTYPFEIFFHLHPDIVVEQISQTRAILRTLDQTEIAQMSVSKETKVAVLHSTWHPTFGAAKPSLSLCVTRINDDAEHITTVFDWNPSCDF